MKIVLIEPPMPGNERYTKGFESIQNVLPPLGIAYVASSLIKSEFDVTIIDAFLENLPLEDIFKKIDQIGPRIIGFRSIVATFDKTCALAKSIKKRYPDLVILLGGPHASMVKGSILDDHHEFDIIVLGEGEVTVCELASSIENNMPLSGVRGIAFRENRKVVTTISREPIKDLDTISYPAWDKVPLHLYAPSPHAYKKLPIVTIIASRGCPFPCTFCSKDVFGRSHRRRSPKNVIKEMVHHMERFGIKEFCFYDDVFTINTKWVKEFCEVLIKEKLDCIWSCDTRVDLVTPEILKLMKKAGCWNIFYGLESGSQKLLDKVVKSFTLSDVRNAVKWTHDSGIEIRASFMLALPGESPELAQETIDFAIELNCKYTKFNIASPFPGTEMYLQALEDGTIVSNLNQFTTQHPVFIPSGYKDQEEILEIKKRAYHQFYLRPSYFLKRLTEIRSFEDIKRYLKGLNSILSVR